MKELNNVTLVCVDTVNYGQALQAIYKSLEQITPARTVFFTDIGMAPDGIDVINIKHLYSKKDYSKFMMKELGKHKFDTSHLLVIQWDGYVLDGEQWDDENLKYDYMGPLWLYNDGHANGNGGFSLRSTRLHEILAKDDFILPVAFEDDGICRTYRNYLEQKYDIVFAPDDLCLKFGFELRRPQQPTFGFHSFFHKPYVEPIVIKREGAMGDVIQVEPVLEYFHKKGHPVYLDSPFYGMFKMHHYPVGDYATFDKEVIKHRVINLDSAYEINPAQLHLKSYFEAAGISDYVLRNPKLNYRVDDGNRIFKQRYVVIHIDKRETNHRNQYGIRWKRVADFFESRGYLVIQIGRNESTDVGIRFNTVNDLILMWLLAGCDLFVGIDSGPAQMAVALDRKCVLLFGSVNPAFIHPDMSKIKVLQSPCPAKLDHCWHSERSNKGVECVLDPYTPPCCIHDTDHLIDVIKQQL